MLRSADESIPVLEGTQAGASATPTTGSRTAVVTWWTYAAILPLLLAAVFAYGILRAPVQLSDGIEPTTRVFEATSLWTLMTSSVMGSHYFRPWRFGQTWVVAAVAPDPWVAFKGIHVMLLFAMVLAFVAACVPRSTRDALAVGAASVVLFGHYTFRSLVSEAYPINHFLEIILAWLVVLVLARRRPFPGSGALILCTLVFSLSTIESGLIVPACILAAWWMGFPGISRRVVTMTCAIVGVYVVVRVGVVGLPDAFERTSGFGFMRPTRDELVQYFEGRHGVFYAYNVMAAAVSLVCSDPRDGVFVLAKQLAEGHTEPWMWINVVSSVATSLLIAWAALRHDRTAPGLRLLLVAVCVMGANALISFPYLKNEMLSVGGVAYALAAFVAIREALRWGDASPRRGVAVGAALVCLMAMWGVRVVGNGNNLQRWAEKQRNEWAQADGEIARLPPASRIPTGHLQRRAIALQIPNGFLTPLWMERWLDPGD